MGNLLGHTAQSASIVLAAYMAGLAIGYLLASRLVVTRPLRAYGAAELCVAGWAALVPLLLRGLEAAGVGALLGGAGAGLAGALGFALCFLLLLPATTAMGSTLPFISEWLERGGPGDGRRTASFYGLNTAGALVGVGAGLAFLLVVVGVARSTWLAAAISAACGFAALGLARGRPPPECAKTPSADPGWNPRWTGAVALAGFSVMALEVLYTRLFALVFHNSTYTFGLVVGVALCCLAVAAWLVGWLKLEAMTLARAAAVAAGVLAPASVVVFLLVGELDYARIGGGFASYMAGAFGFVFIVAGPPLLALGVLLPASWRALGAGGGAGARLVGRMTTVSTLSGVAGALVASFLLLPALGLWGGFVVLVALVAVTGVVLARRGPALGVLGVGVLLASAGAFMAVRGHADQALAADPAIVQRWEGAYGWTDLERDPQTGHAAIVQNLYYSMGSSKPMARELWQGDLPMLLHPAPRTVGFLGMGTGITASSALDHPSVEQIVVMELIPEVVEAARLLGPENGHLLEDPRTVLLVDDARHALADPERRYDVLVSDLVVPWESRTGYLFTVEHYERVRARLAPGGVFCLWLALYQVGEQELNSILDGFAETFPTTTVWWGDTSVRWPLICVMGSEAPLTVDLAVLDQRQQALLSRAAPRAASRALPLAQLLGDWRPTGTAPANTDEHPWVEFRAPITHSETRLIQDERLLSLYDRVLARLPREGVVATRDGVKVPLPAQRAPSSR